MSIAVDPQIESENVAVPFLTRYQYRVGDVNGDGYVDSIDSSRILSAIETHRQMTFSDVLPISVADSNLSLYFPYDTPLFADVADCNDDAFITQLDAQCVMNFYLAASTDEQYIFEEVGYAGEWRYKYI